MNTFLLFNRQRTKRLDLRLLREICRAVLEEASALQEAPSSYEIALHLVGAKEITRLNAAFLCHEGPTDVITFDYAQDSPAASLSGEIFICMDEAVSQAGRFSTQWQSELVRYFVHAVLHLRGYDDVNPALRHEMKRQEDRILKGLSRRLDLGKLAAGSK